VSNQVQEATAQTATSAFITLMERFSDLAKDSATNLLMAFGCALTLSTFVWETALAEAGAERFGDIEFAAGLVSGAIMALGGTALRVFARTRGPGEAVKEAAEALKAAIERVPAQNGDGI
jgi:hypothetical protein